MTSSKSFKFELYHLFLPILGLGLSILITLIARFLLIFIVRPVMIWFNQFREYLLNSFLINITQNTGTEWLDKLLVVIIGVFVVFLLFVWTAIKEAIKDAIKEEQGIDISNLFNISNLPYQGVWRILLAAFTCLGWSFAPLLYVLGPQALLILICPFVIFLCFFNTILDYHNFLNIITSGATSNVYFDIFTDLAHKKIKNLAYVSDFIDWIKDDRVIINNFFSYWFYSLRASVLGFRFSGIWQWILAFPINILASIVYFRIGLFITSSSAKRQLNTNGITDNSNSSEFNLALTFIFSIILAGFASWWILAGSQPGSHANFASDSNAQISAPKKTIVRYYQLATRNRNSAIQLLSDNWIPREAKRLNYNDSWWNSVKKVEVYAFQTFAQNSSKAKIKVWLKYYMKNGLNNCESLIFNIILDRNRNQWLLDSIEPNSIVQKQYCDAK